MEDPIVEMAKYASPAAVGLLLLWKILIPWSEYALKGKSKGLEARVHKIETNDLHEVAEFRQETRESFSKVYDRINGLSERVSRIEGRLNGSLK